MYSDVGVITKRHTKNRQYVLIQCYGNFKFCEVWRIAK